MAYKTDRAAAGAYISACAGVVVLLAALLRPYMPSFSDAVLAQMGLAGRDPGLGDDLVERVKAPAALVPAGHTLPEAEPTPLFRKIGEEEVEALRAR